MKNEPWERLLKKKGQLDELTETSLPWREAKESFEKSFDIEYAHNSTAIEGNTLTLIEAKAVIEDGIAVGGNRY